MTPDDMDGPRLAAVADERAAFDAWFAAQTFETLRPNWEWAAWQARSRLGAPAAEDAAREFEFSIEEQDGDAWFQAAGGICGAREDAEREAAHYATQYAQDGAIRVTVFTRSILSRTEISRARAAKEQG